MFVIHHKIKSLEARLLGFISVVLLAIPVFVAAAERLTISEAKVYYTLEIAKHIKWPHEEDMGEIVIGLLGVDQDLKSAFDQQGTVKIKGKSLRIENINDPNGALDGYSIIYLSENRRALNRSIFARAANALIITDGRVDKDYQMVSIISFSRRVTITLNRENLTARGFVASITLLDLAGTRKDLSNQLRDSESILKILVGQVEDKQKALDELNENLKTKSALLNSAEKKLTENRIILDENGITLAENSKVLEENLSQLESLFLEIDVSKSEVRKNLLDIGEQKSLIEQKQSEILSKENEVTLLQDSIEENRSILGQQSSMIEQQSDTIRNKDRMIVAIVLVSLVFFIMIYLLLRVNRLRRKSNEELKDVNSKLYELATTDGMTNLFNRRHFLEISQREFIRQQRLKSQFALLMMDIDFFKQVNDKYGHAMGDEAIRSVARLLNGSLREYDLAGRIGGEEFAMMLVNCDIGAASEIAQRLCKEISETKVIYSGQRIKITISIGLSQLEAGDADVEQTLHRADKALYKAKQSGRNRVVIYSV